MGLVSAASLGHLRGDMDHRRAVTAMIRYAIALACGITALGSAPLRGAEATVAVAANFLPIARELEAAFEATGSHGITLAHGSTGRLYAQIVQGAPFDLFLSADTERPARLEAEGRAVTRAVYAVGRLVLVTRNGGPETLGGQRIALADPEVAPYGRAAMEAFSALGYEPEDATLFFGDSVGQSANIFATGNATAAFLAEAQLGALPGVFERWPMDGRHEPILQEAALLTRGADNAAARAFFAFLTGPEGRAWITSAGYGVPVP